MNRFPAFGVLLASAAVARAHESVVPHSHSVDPQTSDLLYLSLAVMASVGMGLWLFRLVARRRDAQEARARSHPG